MRTPVGGDDGRASAAPVLLVSADLMTQTRVSETLARHGHRVDCIERPDAAAVGRAAAIVVDMNTPGWQEVVALGRTAGRPVLAFGAHVERDRLAQAMAAGCHTVVTRGRFFAEMPVMVERLVRAVPEVP